MSLLRWTLGGFGALLCLLAAVAAGAGLLGVFSGWADVLNHFIPIWFVTGSAGVLIARAALSKGRIRLAVTLLGLLGIGISGAPILYESVQGARQPAPTGATLKVMTFNRWWDADPTLAAAAIRRSGADIVTLQEANGFSKAAPSLLDLYPYQLPCPLQCDTYILSKRPILDFGEVTPPQRDARDLIWARIPTPDGGTVTVATIHLFWPLPPWVQGRQRDQLAVMAAELPKDDLILTGDFNSTPWSFGLREFDQVLAPLTRRTHGILTFPANRFVPILALDQIYAGRKWRAARVERLPFGGSDHYPLLATFGR